jgi:hypothetical protein
MPLSLRFGRKETFIPARTEMSSAVRVNWAKPTLHKSRDWRRDICSLVNWRATGLFSRRKMCSIRFHAMDIRWLQANENFCNTLTTKWNSTDACLAFA